MFGDIMTTQEWMNELRRRVQEANERIAARELTLVPPLSGVICNGKFTPLQDLPVQPLSYSERLSELLRNRPKPGYMTDKRKRSASDVRKGRLLSATSKLGVIAGVFQHRIGHINFGNGPLSFFVVW